MKCLIAVVRAGVNAHACILILHARENAKFKWHVLIAPLILIIMPNVLRQISRQRRICVGQEELVVVNEVIVFLILSGVEFLVASVGLSLLIGCRQARTHLFYLLLEIKY